MGENGYVVVCCQKCGWIDRSAILSVGRHGRDKKHVKNGHAVCRPTSTCRPMHIHYMLHVRNKHKFNSLFPKVAPGHVVFFSRTKNNGNPCYSPHDDAPTTAPIAFIL